jgi:subtilisin family serine protease
MLALTIINKQEILAMKFSATMLAVSASVLMPLSAGSVLAADADSAVAVNRATQDMQYALVQLNGEPLATYVKTKPPAGKKLDFDQSATKAYRAHLAALRNDYKAWLREHVPQASVSGEFDISLNAVSVKLGGASLAQVAASPMVRTAQYQGLYYPNAVDPDLAIIRATDAWAFSSGSAADAGNGVKVAIIDSGIDVGHPCFTDTGYDAQTQVGNRGFTNNKVIAAKVFNNKIPSRRYTPEAVDSHGTHVAGTVACNFETQTVVDGVTLPYKMSGVAPRALLGNYNVFPGSVGNARSEDILNALEAAYADGFDIANMSLGGGANGIQDLLTVAVDNLDRANMVVTISNGNAGPGYRTVGSPGSAERGLTAGASSVGHELFHVVTVGGAGYRAVKGDFGVDAVTAPLRVLGDAASPFNGLSLACSSFTAGSLAGSVALISRGACSFSTKLRNVQAAGGVGAIVVNNTAGTIVMGQDGTASQPTIPGFMVDPAIAGALKASDGASTTLPQLGTYEAVQSNDDIIADFTSWGPTDVDFRIKPDVMAPGVNVVSSIPRSYCGGAPCFAFFNGTSMAAPHLAGSAAIVRQQHPTWSAAAVRSAIVNTADRKVVKELQDNATIITDANKVGTGRENLLAAVQARVALDPVSLSFGAVPSGSGNTLERSVQLTNIGGAAQTFSLQVVEASGSAVAFSVPGGAVSLAQGESATVVVTMSALKGAGTGRKQAVLQVSAGGSVVAQAMLFALIK